VRTSGGGCETALASAQDRERINFIKQAFLQYYSKKGSRITLPPDSRSREFAFLAFGEKFMTRHKAIGSLEELVNNIRMLVPSDIYYSTAYYEKPAEVMDRKGWLGSDLVFDIDADHIETSCKAVHDIWACANCGLTKQGKPPSQCPDCGKTRLEERTWFCDECLNAAKKEVLKLVDFLTRDFGMPEQGMHIFFSGHRGYHLHIRTEEVRKLDESQRTEIVDYLRALGLDLSHLGLPNKGPRDTITGPQRSDPGWRGRIAREIYTLISQATEKDFTELGFSPRRARKIVSELPSRVQQDWKEEILWSEYEDSYGIKDEHWQKIIPVAIKRAAMDSLTDTVVTTDIHRLIRLPETLNGKTGLRATAVQDLEKFDPFRDPIAFEGEETVRVTYAPAFRMGNANYGPYVKQDVKLPAAAAMLLLCKGVGDPIQK
jgi:DNA primase small subunit